MFSVRKVIGLLAVLVVSTPASAATINLDNFDNPMTGGNSVGGVLTAAGNTVTGGPDSGGSILGTRNVSLTNSGSGNATTQIQGFSLILGTSGGGSDNKTTLAYTSLPGSPLNLTNNNGIALNISNYNPGTAGFVTTALARLNGNATALVNIAGDGSLFIPFGALSRDAVTSIQLEFNLTQNADFQVDAKNGVTITETPTPEPMTLAAFGVMSLVGGVYGRRKLKARSVAQA